MKTQGRQGRKGDIFDSFKTPLTPSSWFLSYICRVQARTCSLCLGMYGEIPGRFAL